MTAVASPVRKSDVKPHLSASQLRSYAECSLRWLLSRTHRPEFTSPALAFGSAFHAAAQGYHQARLEGRDFSADEAVEIFETVYKETGRDVPIRYTEKSSEAQSLELGKAVIAAYLEQARPGTLIAIEEPFEVVLADDLPAFRGRIDLIEIVRNDDGADEVHLIDLKTASRKPSAGSAPDPDQLVIYANAMTRIGLLRELGLPLKLRFDVMTKTKSPALVSVPVEPKPGASNRLVAKARACWRGMSEAIAFPNPGWMCSGCGYQKLCRSWPDCT